MNLCVFNHHLIKKKPMLLEQVGKEETISNTKEKYKKPTSQLYYEGFLNSFDFNLRSIYLLLRMVTVNTKLKSFSVQNTKQYFSCG